MIAARFKSDFSDLVAGTGPAVWRSPGDRLYAGLLPTSAPVACPLSPLAHRRVLKMNGLGNEIVVLDLRDSDHVVTAEEARAIGRAPASPSTS